MVLCCRQDNNDYFQSNDYASAGRYLFAYKHVLYAENVFLSPKSQQALHSFLTFYKKLVDKNVEPEIQTLFLKGGYREACMMVKCRNMTY